MKKKPIIIMSVVIALIVSFLVYSHFENTVIQVTDYTLRSERLPSAFDGFKIVQVSDLHSSDFSNNYSSLISRIKKCKPDIIVLTGDLCAAARPSDMDSSLLFVEKALEIAPVYYVTGNHEEAMENYLELMVRMEEIGATVLNDDEAYIVKNGESIRIIGLSDLSFSSQPQSKYDSIVREKLDRLASGDGEYTLLLSHRPEVFNAYSDYDIDLVLTGHAHGGQIRLPFIGGLFAPGQGIFPKYTSGIHVKNGTSMIVSRGIGSSSFPFRINNNPELVCVTLKKS